MIAEQPLSFSLPGGPRLRAGQWGYTVYRVYDRTPRPHCLHLTRRQRADSSLEPGELGWCNFAGILAVIFALLFA